ncbi:MAG: hypothetical protein GF315_07015, partial [candidate division Zixibacteria bacterium]|nr:hypothetical protein [candidate division Zixibacteria bacterium]
MCSGGYLADDFVYADARFAVGNDSSVWPSEQFIRITRFFQRMDGYGPDGQYDRRADSAVGDLDTCLIWDGLPNTTLSPSIDSVWAFAPLEAGDSIIIKLETNGDENHEPDIIGLHCLIENEYWKDSLTIIGHCTWTPEPKAYSFAFILPWDEVYSANNWAALDGNTKPIGSGIYNAKGPSEDDYTRLFVDSSNQIYFANPYGYRPENIPISTEWQRLRPSSTSNFEISDWQDDGDNILSAGDIIEIYDMSTYDTTEQSVSIVTPIMKVTRYKTEMYLEMIEYNPLISDWPVPIGTYWVEINPNYTKAYQIVDWEDYDYSGDLTIDDYVGLYVLNGPDSGQIYLNFIDDYMTGLLTFPPC